jgi:hypothetical protein
MTTLVPSQRRGEKRHSRFTWSRSRAAPHVPSECSNPSRAPITSRGRKPALLGDFRHPTDEFTRLNAETPVK